VEEVDAVSNKRVVEDPGFTHLDVERPLARGDEQTKEEEQSARLVRLFGGRSNPEQLAWLADP
jgi:hypothetical protein